MQEVIVEFLKSINIGQLIAMGAMLWFFYNRLDGKIEKLDGKIDKVNDQLSGDISKLAEKIEDIDRRLCRIEGSLATQGHCLFNHAHSEKKAE